MITLLIFILFSSLILIFILPFIFLFILAGNWKLLDTAKEEGWKGIIPFYNTWTMCKVIGVSPYWVYEILIVSCTTSFVSIALGKDALLSQVLGGISLINSLYFGIIYSISLVRSFNKDDKYAILVFLIPFVGIPLIAFNNPVYVGRRGVDDRVMKFLLNSFGIEDIKYTHKNKDKYCPNCGNKVKDNEVYCPKCGNRID